MSGDINVRAPAEGGYAYEVSTFSGDITDCFDTHSEKTPTGHSVTGTRGAGGGQVRLKAMSGDVQLCDHTCLPTPAQFAHIAPALGRRLFAPSLPRHEPIGSPRGRLTHRRKPAQLGRQQRPA